MHKGMLPIHCICRHHCGEMYHMTYYYYDTMNSNADSLYNVACMQKDYTLMMRKFHLILAVGIFMIQEHHFSTLISASILFVNG